MDFVFEIFLIASSFPSKSVASVADTVVVALAVVSDSQGAVVLIAMFVGLSWLAWALNKPVVLISGFSEPISEFNNPLRVFNPSVCNGCWNDLSVTFDPSNWNWCPRNKDFECSKKISFEMVKEKIDMII